MPYENPYYITGKKPNLFNKSTLSTLVVILILQLPSLQLTDPSNGNFESLMFPFQRWGCVSSLRCKIIEATQKTLLHLLLSMKYWLFNRDPYKGLLYSLYNWVV